MHDLQPQRADSMTGNSAQAQEERSCKIHAHSQPYDLRNHDPNIYYGSGDVRASRRADNQHLTITLALAYALFAQ